MLRIIVCVPANRSRVVFMIGQGSLYVEHTEGCVALAEHCFESTDARMRLNQLREAVIVTMQVGMHAVIGMCDISP